MLLSRHWERTAVSGMSITPHTSFLVKPLGFGTSRCQDLWAVELLLTILAYGFVSS